MTGGPNYVELLAVRWAEADPIERWVDAAPDGVTPLDEVVLEYLGKHNPFPDDAVVEAVGLRDDVTWERATVVGRVGVDEWTVELTGGSEVVWRDHHELRALNQPVGGG